MSTIPTTREVRCVGSPDLPRTLVVAIHPDYTVTVALWIGDDNVGGYCIAIARADWRDCRIDEEGALYYLNIGRASFEVSPIEAEQLRPHLSA